MSRATPGSPTQAYVRLKLAVGARLRRQLIVRLRGVPAQSPLSRVVAEIIDVWAAHAGIVYQRADSDALITSRRRRPSSCRAGRNSCWRSTSSYRERRLHFLIEGQNRLYQLLDEARSTASIRASSTGSSANSSPARQAAPARARRLLQRRRRTSWWRRSFPRAARRRDQAACGRYAEAFVERHGDAARPADGSAGGRRSISMPRRAISTSCWRRSSPAQWHRTRGAKCSSTISDFRSGTC